MFLQIITTAVKTDVTIYIITGCIGGVGLIVTGLIVWMFKRILADRDKILKDLNEKIVFEADVNEKSNKFIEDAFDKMKDKHSVDMEKVRNERESDVKELRADMSKMKDHHTDTYQEIKEAMHSMNDNIIKEIRNIEGIIAKNK